MSLEKIGDISKVLETLTVSRSELFVFSLVVVAIIAFLVYFFIRNVSRSLNAIEESVLAMNTEVVRVVTMSKTLCHKLDEIRENTNKLDSKTTALLVNNGCYDARMDNGKRLK
jgi:low affinity Fe/Cu permease